MLQKLKKALSQRQKTDQFKKRIFHVAGEPVSSAVLIPLLIKDEEYHILFTKRTDTVREHKGQISFPGGAYEREDPTLLDTALRECKEEIGLDCSAVEVLGELDEILTQHTNYLVAPFVGVISSPCGFKADPREVGEILEVPISVLLDKDNLRLETMTDGNGKVIIGYYYNYKGHVIWGATARILTQFLDIWNQVLRDTQE
jgi:8-oxo-dGTP pyrophosphatase MutT (NUDIX family)